MSQKPLLDGEKSLKETVVMPLPMHRRVTDFKAQMGVSMAGALRDLVGLGLSVLEANEGVLPLAGHVSQVADSTHDEAIASRQTPKLKRRKKSKQPHPAYAVDLARAAVRRLLRWAEVWDRHPGVQAFNPGLLPRVRQALEKLHVAAGPNRGAEIAPMREKVGPLSQRLSLLVGKTDALSRPGLQAPEINATLRAVEGELQVFVSAILGEVEDQP